MFHCKNCCRTFNERLGIPFNFIEIIDEDGNLVEVGLSKKQDMEAAKAFFAQAYEVVEQPLQRVATEVYKTVALYGRSSVTI